MFGLSKQVDSVQSGELEFDSIADIELLVFSLNIQTFLKGMDCLTMCDSMLCSL